ncbi:DedA family protein [Streptomyces zagrosensis]|uniref:Membrane protein DedA with SNARE-associated domain n=1 Tax=Streptomyces zagrosensis TaxID=1042984 RepID=A0A7W9QCN1_9ACTN|nr:VTT domain-containing protein [Streptomyces zagrosensis]MBB5937823.1 membrane protein DedA with SNARE-associated domain [Streptomyces zagrosensis]
MDTAPLAHSLAAIDLPYATGVAAWPALAGGLETDLTHGAGWAYALLMLTTLPPLVPNSALLITSGVLAARGSLDIALVLLVVAGSALLGDAVLHWFGGRFKGPVQRWANRTTRRKALLGWSAGHIQRRGVPFVVAVRFLPSGRLIGALGAGVVGYPAHRYLIGAGIAESIWAAYSVGLGYLGSAAARGELQAIAIGCGVSLLVAAVSGYLQLRSRRAAGPSAAPDADDGPDKNG